MTSVSCGYMCWSLAASVNSADPLDSEICGLLESLWFARAHDGSVVCVAARGALRQHAVSMKRPLWSGLVSPHFSHFTAKQQD